MCESLCENSFHSRPSFQTLGNQQVVSVSSPHHMSPHNVCTRSNGQSNTHAAYHKRRESEGQSRPCRMRLCFNVDGIKGNKFCIQWYFQQWYSRYISSHLHDLSRGNVQFLDNTRVFFPENPHLPWQSSPPQSIPLLSVHCAHFHALQSLGTLIGNTVLKKTLASLTRPLQSPLSSSKSAPWMLLVCHKTPNQLPDLAFSLPHPPAKDHKAPCPMARVGASHNSSPRYKGSKNPKGRRCAVKPLPWKPGGMFWSPFSPVLLELQIHACHSLTLG